MDEIKIKNVKQPIGQPENFLRNTLKIGGSVMISIPKEILELEGIQEGDLVKVWIKKVYEK